MKSIVVGLFGLLFSASASAGPCTYLGKVNGQKVQVLNGFLVRASNCYSGLAVVTEMRDGSEADICLSNVDHAEPPIETPVGEYLESVMRYWEQKDPTAKIPAGVCGYYELNSHRDPVLAVFAGWTHF